MQKQVRPTFDDIVSVENLLEAWREFVKGKRGKRDVQEFSFHLTDSIFTLHDELSQHTYVHGGYQAFNICDPKPRNIHKAAVRDRLVHHATHRVLYPFFSGKFIADSFSCQVGKGTHRALNRFRTFSYRVSKNNTKTCWILKCDIKKFFASIDHSTLAEVLGKHMSDRAVLWLLGEVVRSFSTSRPGVGLPLGNLTSQLLVNIYMNEFDQFVKHQLKAQYYLRYADDFVILSHDRDRLKELIPKIDGFLQSVLKLALHPDKVFVKTLVSGVDFLGWVHFPDHRALRTTTKRRMWKRLEVSKNKETLHSYLGLLSHGNAYKMRRQILSASSDPHDLL